MIIFAVTNQKGGSGKTTTAMLLADALHRLDAEVLVIDTDPQASAWKWETRASRQLPRFPVRVEKASGLSKEEFAKWLEPKTQSSLDPNKRVDYLIIDTPPALNSQELFAALYICDFAIIPIRPHVAYVDALEEFIQLMEKVDASRAKNGRSPVQCRALLNCYAGRRASEKTLIERISQILPWPILDTGLKDLAAYADAFNFRTSIYALPGGKEARLKLDALAKELVQ
jgi:chromosome partitioning protein